MAKAIEGVDWQAIRDAWERGATSATLAAQHGISANLIRLRASRGKWLTVHPSAGRVLVAKAAKVAVNRAVAKAASRLDALAANGVDACIERAIGLGQKLMTRAEQGIEEAEDSNLSAVATAARTGVDIWRKSLGLDTTGSGSISCAIQFNFVARGADCNATPATLPVAPDATIEVETISGDSQPD